MRVQSHAGEVWQYVNPAVDRASRPILTKPRAPTLMSDIGEPTWQEKEAHQQALMEYKSNLKVYEWQEAKLQELFMFINNQVDDKHLKCSTEDP